MKIFRTLIIFNNVITLPLYPTLKDEQTKYIVEFVLKVWEKISNIKRLWNYFLGLLHFNVNNDLALSYLLFHIFFLCKESSFLNKKELDTILKVLIFINLAQ